MTTTDDALTGPTGPTGPAGAPVNGNPHPPAPSALPPYPSAGYPTATTAFTATGRAGTGRTSYPPAATSTSTGGRALNGTPQRLAASRTKARRQGIALAALLIVAGAAGAVYLSSPKNTQTQIVVLAQAVPRGSIVTAADLATVTTTVTGGQMRASTPATAAVTLVGKAALIDLAKGTPLNPGMVAAATTEPGRTSVGVRVPSDGLPSPKLQAGQVVAVVQTDPTTGDATVIVPAAQVLSVTAPAASGASDGDSVVYLSVPTADAATVAGAASTRDGVRLLGVPS